LYTRCPRRHGSFFTFESDCERFSGEHFPDVDRRFRPDRVFTPIVSPLAALGCAASLVWTVFPWGLLTSHFVAFRLIAMLVAIALIGPGAFSVDAQIFGWKEIVIPSVTQHKNEE